MSNSTNIPPIELSSLKPFNYFISKILNKIRFCRVQELDFEQKRKSRVQVHFMTEFKYVSGVLSDSYDGRCNNGLALLNPLNGLYLDLCKVA